MRYYIDSEFNGFGGEIISFAIVSDNGDSLYLARPKNELQDLNKTSGLAPWVNENVIPVMSINGATPKWLPLNMWYLELQRFLQHDYDITIVADWPEDVTHFMNLLMISPGRMIKIPAFSVEVRRVDAYYANLCGAVRHNALWDARSLRHLYHMESNIIPFAAGM